MKLQKKKNIKPVKKIKESIERAIWEAGAVKINTVNQFTLATGAKSPIYIDCRRLISFPNAMDTIAEKTKELINKNLKGMDILAGGETAGIPFAAWVSAKLGLPMIYVRKAKKEHGAGKQIEGALEKGQKVLLIEDLITSGFSKIGFIEGIRNSGGVIENCLVVFDREQGGKEKLNEMGVKLWRLTNLNKTLDFGLKNKYITQRDFEIVQNYLNSN